MNNSVNLKVLEDALNNVVARDMTEMDLEAPMGREVTGFIADKFGEVLGVEPEKTPFGWEAKVLGDSMTSSLTIGLAKIILTAGKSIHTVIGEIMAAVRDELEGKAFEVTYYNINDDGLGIYHAPRENILDEMSIKELIDYLNKDRYCDEKFVDILSVMGYEVKIGQHPILGDAPYIDLSNGDETKIWLQEANRQHTLYRSIETRSRLEVLYLLHAWKFHEIWFEEG